MRLRAATRGSPLARRQTQLIAELLAPEVDVDVVVVETTGDRRTDVPIHQIGGQGVFVKEVQQAVLDGRADIAVHSAKDLPSTPTDGLLMGAVPERDDPRDAMVGARLDALPVGARVATGSVRRRAQLAAARPDLTFAELRGNIETRLAKAESHHAVVMAAAALRRLGLAGRIAELLDPAVVLPQVAQGALAVECRAGDDRVAGVLAAIEHRPSRLAVDAERAFLAALGGGCDLPAGAYATVDADGRVSLSGLLATYDGRVVLRATMAGPDPAAVGADLADHLLVGAGGAALLEDIRA
jgi:hydroxymethylbilane synthase